MESFFYNALSVWKYHGRGVAGTKKFIWKLQWRINKAQQEGRREAV